MERENEKRRMEGKGSGRIFDEYQPVSFRNEKGCKGLTR